MPLVFLLKLCPSYRGALHQLAKSSVTCGCREGGGFGNVIEISLVTPPRERHSFTRFPCHSPNPFHFAVNSSLQHSLLRLSTNSTYQQTISTVDPQRSTKHTRRRPFSPLLPATSLHIQRTSSSRTSPERVANSSLSILPYSNPHKQDS